MHKDMELEITADGPRKTEVRLNGEMIPVRSINVDFKYDEIPLAAVELEVPYAHVDGQVRVYLHPETVRLLKASGWREPVEGFQDWPKLALVLLAVGGSVTITDKLLVETDFDKLVIIDEPDPTNHATIVKIVPVQEKE